MIFENSVIFAEFSVKPKSDLKSNILLFFKLPNRMAAKQNSSVNSLEQTSCKLDNIGKRKSKNN